MYLRPRSLSEKFLVQERRTRLSEMGRQEVTFQPTGEEVLGVVASAQPEERERFKGLKHQISHVVIQRGKRLLAKVGDRLVKDDKIFYVEATDEPAGLGQWYIYYCSERFDTP